MAKSKKSRNASIEEVSETSEVENTTPAGNPDSVYTLKSKLSQDSRLQPITTIDGITYFKGTPNPEIDDTEISNKTIAELEEAIADARSAKIAEMNGICDKLLTSFISSATGQKRIYDSGVEDQLNILALVAAGVDSYFRCALPGGSKENINHTAAQMKQVFADGVKHKSIIIGICGILKAYIKTQTDCDKIKTIEWSWFDTDIQSIIEPLPADAVFGGE